MIIQDKPAAIEFSDNLGTVLALGLISDTVKVEVAITNWKTVYSQLLPVYDDGNVRFVEFDLAGLMEPYSKQFSSFPLQVTITDGVLVETIDCWVHHHDGDIRETFAEFVGNRFLSNATSKRTTLQRKEVLYFPYGGDKVRTSGASIRVYYDDSTYRDVPLTVGTEPAMQNIFYITFCAKDFAQDGKGIYRMVATVTTELLGNDSQVEETRYATMEYLIDFEHEAEPGPVFIYENAFGVPEKLYCTGNTENEVAVERESAMIGGKYVNYRQTATRTCKTDTGILSPEEAEVAMEMMRSPSIMQCAINQWGEYSPWKEVAITKSDLKYTDDDDTLPRLTFTYRNAEKHVTAQSSKEFPYIFGAEHTVMFE